MERPGPQPEVAEDELVARVRERLDTAESAGDESRLETLEEVRTELEAELDSSLENGTSRH